MPFAIAAAVAALIGMTARDIAVAHHEHDVATVADARFAAVHEAQCQDSLRLATTDSVRATIVDGCVQRILAKAHEKAP